MPSNEKSRQDFGNRLESLARDDKEIETAARFLWVEARKDAEMFPAAYLLMVHNRIQRLSKKIGESAVKVVHANNCRTDAEAEESEVRSEIQRCETDSFVRTHLSQISNIDRIEKLDLIENDELLREAEEQLIRDAAISVAWRAATNAAWHSAGVGAEMPPFEPKEQRKKKVAEVNRRLKEAESQFAASLMHLMSLLEEVEELPVEPVTKLLKRDSQEYIEDLKQKYPEEASVRRNRFIRIAERSQKQLERRGSELLRTLVDRRNAKLLAGLYSHFSLESSALSDLLSTDFGAEWVVDEGEYDKVNFRASARREMENLLLTIGCYQDVVEALNKDGDPNRALVRIAPKTAHHATEDQKEHLKTALKTLTKNSSLKDSARDEWKTALTDESTKGGAKIGGISRLACKCFDADSKGELPQRYQGYQNGEFATLVRDLYYGTWKTS